MSNIPPGVTPNHGIVNSQSVGQSAPHSRAPNVTHPAFPYRPTHQVQPNMNHVLASTNLAQVLLAEQLKLRGSAVPMNNAAQQQLAQTVEAAQQRLMANMADRSQQQRMQGAFPAHLLNNPQLSHLDQQMLNFFQVQQAVTRPATAQLSAESIFNELEEEEEDLSIAGKDILSSEWSPGVLVRAGNVEVLQLSKIIADHFATAFEDTEANKKTEEMKKLIKDNEAKIEQFRLVSMVQGPHLIEEGTRKWREEIIKAQRQLERLDQNRDKRYKKIVSDAIKRVTLQIAASSVNTNVNEGEFLNMVARQVEPCPNCRSTDESRILIDERQGDRVCRNCGFVEADKIIYDGDWTRSFEGEESTSQIGPPPNPLLSNRANLSTGIGDFAGMSRSQMRQIRLIAAAVDRGSGNTAAGVSDRRTRVSYKDRMKLQASEALTAAGECLGFAKPTVERAKVIFAAFRDNREHLTNYQESLAACLLAAVEETIFNRLKTESSLAKAAAERDDWDKDELARSETKAAPLSEKEKQERARRLREKELEEERVAKALGLVGRSRWIHEVLEGPSESKAKKRREDDFRKDTETPSDSSAKTESESPGMSPESNVSSSASTVSLPPTAPEQTASEAAAGSSTDTDSETETEEETEDIVPTYVRMFKRQGTAPISNDRIAALDLLSQEAADSRAARFPT